MTYTYKPWRIASGLLGIGAAGLGCYGAWEYAYKLEGQWSYLVLASPVIAGAAALIPPQAEWLWAQGARIKALLWWVTLIPAVAVVFFAAAERVHVAKAGAQAGRDAARLAVELAQAERTTAQAALAQAKADADKTLKWKKCGTECQGIRAAVPLRQADFDQAEAKLLKARTQSTQDAPLQAPVWLLPAALDVVAFMAIWTGFSGPWRIAAPVAVKPQVKRKAKPRRKRLPRPTNDNVVNIRGA